MLSLAQAEISTENLSHDTNTITNGLPALPLLFLVREESSTTEEILTQEETYILGSQESWHQGVLIWKHWTGIRPFVRKKILL